MRLINSQHLAAAPALTQVWAHLHLQLNSVNLLLLEPVMKRDYIKIKLPLPQKLPWLLKKVGLVHRQLVLRVQVQNIPL